MRHNFLDRYGRIDSPVHRLPAFLKMGAAVSLILGAVAVPLPGVWFFAGAAIALILLAYFSRIPGLFLVKRLLYLEPLVLGIAILSLLKPDGGSIFLGIMMRSTLSLFAMILLSNTTPFTEILNVLRRLRVPPLLVTILALMYRYLFVLIDEAERMQRARQSRSTGSSRTEKWSSSAGLIGQLFVRSTERAERIYAAMCARGWE